MSDETIRVIASYNNLCKFIHLPFQSGSNKILSLMNRKYTREWYLSRIKAIKKYIPECGLSTDVFCGFHNETEEDHKETLSLMETVEFDTAFMFKYSERPGTYAAQKLVDNVPEEIKTKRLNEIIELQNRISLKKNREDIGKNFEVLIENISKKSRDEFSGRTSQNKVVVFPRGVNKIGDLVSVKILDATSATLRGEII